MGSRIIYITGVLSLVIQIITGVFDYYVIGLSVPQSMNILMNLLILEFAVQIIEGAFYIWMVFNFSKISNITPARYYDWFITTPTMLFTLCFYLIYLKNKEAGIDIGYGTGENSFFELVSKNLHILIPIFILNGAMLAFGYLGEIGKLERYTATFLGFIPFIIYFYMIYINFASDSVTGKQIFWWFFCLWSLYGVASLMSYNVKNAIYNILDLFAKNFFGIYLALLLFNAQIFETKT
jgi:bacteriorhodopsin